MTIKHELKMKKAGQPILDQSSAARPNKL